MDMQAFPEDEDKVAFADIVKLISAGDADGALRRLRSYGQKKYSDGYDDCQEYMQN